MNFPKINFPKINCNRKVIYILSLVFLLFLLVIWWFFYYKNFYQSWAIATNNLKPIELKFYTWDRYNFSYSNLSFVNSDIISKDAKWSCLVSSNDGKSTLKCSWKNILSTSGTVYLYSLLLKTDINNVILSYVGKKPNFSIIQWWDYTNSWDNIIFWQSNLVLKFNDIHVINGEYFYSWDILVINNLVASPKFHTLNVSYDISGLNYENSLIDYFFPVSYLVSDETQKLINDLSLDKNISKINHKFSYGPVYIYDKWATLSFKWWNRIGWTVENVKIEKRKDWKIERLDEKTYTLLNSWDDLVIKFNQLEKSSSYQLKFDVKDVYKYSYDISINTYDVFAQTKYIDKTQFSWDNYELNQHICFNQPVEENSTRNLFEKSFGSGNISLVFSQNNVAYTNQKNWNFCLMYYFFLNPEKEHKFDIKGIKSVFWESLDTTVTIGKHTIPEKYKFVSMIWNWMNTLPANGFWNDKIQIAYKNIFTWNVFFKTCNIVTDDNKVLTNMNGTWVENQEIVNNLIECETSYKQYNMTFSGFEYWKNKVVDVPLKATFGDNLPRIFVATANDEVQPKVFFRTNIWALVKKSWWLLHIWANKMDTWEPFGALKLDVHYFTWWKFSTTQKDLKDWYSTFDIWEFEWWYIIASDWDDKIILSLSDSDNIGRMTDQKDSYGYNVYKYFSNSQFMYADSSIGCNWGCGYIPGDSVYKIFAYTDRVLYKPWDKLFISGWLRKPWFNDLPKWWITVEFKNNIDYSTLFSKTVDSFDEFGGFTTDFEIPSNIKLWDYSINLTYTDDKWRQSWFDQYIKIEEYKKKSFAVDVTPLQDTKWNDYFRLYPKYYFWPDLPNYDLNLVYSLRADHYGYYDWSWCGQQWCDSPYYYNRVWWNDEYAGGTKEMLNYTWLFADIPLKDVNSKFVWDFNMDITVKDKSSWEIVLKNYSQKVYPDYIIGFKGWDYDWWYIEDKDFKINWKVWKFKEDKWDIMQNYSVVQSGKVKILTYYKDFSLTTEKGPDWEWYYAWEDFKKLWEDEVLVRDSDFNYNLKIDKVGKYFVRAIFDNGYEVQKTINVYTKSDYRNWIYGEMSNNWALTVYVKDKQYMEWEDMIVNIEPYIKWAYAIVTVEKENRILEKQTIKLESDQIRLKVKKDWFPNTYVSVAMIVGEQVNSQLSDKRQEPRFFIWYANVKLDPKNMALNFDLSVTDKNWKTKMSYLPWEEVTLHVKAKDTYGNPVKSRFSVAVVDKALLDLYDEMKKPIDRFYTYVWNWFNIVTNYKTLYKSLKVFSADGTKWWAWGYNALIQPRKRFLDVAFWSGKVVTDDNWNATINFIVPDNLTSWSVETIWITNDLKMWTERYYFKVVKPVSIEPNLPAFLTLWDKIQVPVRLSSSEIDLSKVKLTWEIKVWNSKYDLNFYQKDSVNTADVDLTKIADKDLFANNYVTFSAQAQVWDKAYDAVEYLIPLRKDWYNLQNFYTAITNVFEKEFNFEWWAKYAKVNISISNLPVDGFNSALRYLMHYPYGCSEQLASWLFPMVVASSLSKEWFIDKSLVSWNNVYINWIEYELGKTVDETLSKIYKNQKWDWLFGYWTDSNETSSPYLSIYLYSLFTYLDKNWYKVQKDVFINLENALTKVSDPKTLMYFNLLKSFEWWNVDLKLIDEKIRWGDEIVKVLWNLIKYYKWQKADTDLIERTLASDRELASTDWYWTFLDKDILKAFYIKALVKNWDLTTAKEYIFQLDKRRDTSWTWGWSTQKNLQIMLALADYMKAVKSSDEKINYSFKLGDKDITWTLDKDNIFKDYSYDLENIDNLKFNFKSDKAVLSSIKVTYLPKDLKNIKDQMNNVSDVDFKFNSWGIDVLKNAWIWDKIQAEWKFKITKDASQFAVSYNIPSTYYIINPNIARSSVDNSYGWYDYTNQLLNFENLTTSSNWYSCWPTYYEVKYDRLFLYYDKLPAWAACKINFNIMKTHNWEINISPINLFEMYKTSVWWNKVVK